MHFKMPLFKKFMILQFYFDYHWRAGSYFHFSTVVVIACVRNYLGGKFWMWNLCLYWKLNRIKAILFCIWLSLLCSSWLTYSVYAWYIQWSPCGVQRDPMLPFCFRGRVSLLCFCCTVLISFQPFLFLPPSLTQEACFMGYVSLHLALCVGSEVQTQVIRPLQKYFTNWPFCLDLVNALDYILPWNWARGNCKVYKLHL